jgi:hypothetical protein
LLARPIPGIANGPRCTLNLERFTGYIVVWCNVMGIAISMNSARRSDKKAAAVTVLHTSRTFV